MYRTCVFMLVPVYSLFKFWRTLTQKLINKTRDFPVSLSCDCAKLDLCTKYIFCTSVKIYIPCICTCFFSLLCAHFKYQPLNKLEHFQLPWKLDPINLTQIGLIVKQYMFHININFTCTLYVFL